MQRGLLVGSMAAGVFLYAQQPAGSVDFREDVQPILEEHCTVCHKGSNAPAGLRLDSAAGLLRGSASGKVVMAGKSAESVLAQRLTDADNPMPPSGPIAKEKIAVILQWIDQGAQAGVTAAELTAPPPRIQTFEPSVTKVATVADERALLNYYCVVCHAGSDAPMGLKLDELDAAHVEKARAKWELVVRKLRAGMMPPAGNGRPAPAVLESMIEFLENSLDRHAVTRMPAPGIHRLNRTEYANAIQDLLALTIDPAKFLPSDDSTRGFDNIAGALAFSPALVEGYAAAAEKIGRLALGDTSQATSKVCRVPEDNSQDYHIDGMPFATRGGILCDYEFPADGDYAFKIYPINQGLMDNNRAFGEIRGEKVELLVDGALVKLYDWDKELANGPAVHGGTKEVQFPVKAGLHRVAATFLATQLAPSSDLDEHFERSTIETGGLPGFKFYPHVGKLDILGPFQPAGAADSPSRRKIFVCRAAEVDCVRQIVATLARHAFRRPVTDHDVMQLLAFYEQGRSVGGFDAGIERVLERILADARFVFRKEAEPAHAPPGQPYRISDLELASRLSFFLWSSIPDDPLIDLAAQNKLHEPAVLEQQVRRMLADPRSDRLVANFAGQWLNLRSFQTFFPIPGIFPDWDDNLRFALRRETELFVSSIIHEDRSVLDLLNGNHTFLNERLAKHYGIPDVYGSNFRRVELPPEFDMRRGLLGKGAIEAVSAYANRTSPSVRGKTMMQIFLGIEPPPAPPNLIIPALKEPEGAVHGTGRPTVRQQIEMHRKNEPCATCHKIMDPIGLSLENFDATGRWRTTDDGSPIDTEGQLVDGTPLHGVTDLRNALLRYSPQFVRLITEKLMIYALGRGTEYFDMPLIRSIVHDAERRNYRFSSLVLGVVKSEPFQMNQTEPRPSGSGSD